MSSPRPSHVGGAPLTTVAALIAGDRIDDLLGRAAHRYPDRVALRCTGFGERPEVGYAELDRAATRLAGTLRALAGGTGRVIALALALDPAFPPAFFGVVRSGNVPALVNPLLRGEALAHVLALSGATVGIVPPELCRRIRELPDRPPQLSRLVLTHRDEDADLAGVPTVAELLDAAGPAGPEPTTGPADELGCIQFTSGSTGPAKGVRLSHRNIVVNAAQVAHTHRLDHDSVVFNYLPSYHLMHLTASVAAGATHVLCRREDPADAVRDAALVGATHFYSLPMRLIRLAGAPAAPPAAPTLRALLCGGSALPAPTVDVLTDRFGVPVVQGYGLQETSPLTHFNDIDAARIGSSGTPVPGTEARIVDPDTRRVLDVDERGELEVRGPQVMLGYLGAPPGAHLSMDGWFATGDIARHDADGHLFVVDRIKDTFKRDNWLVSPTQIERVLRRHPAVADCAVVDRPHPVSGAVAHAFVIAGGAGSAPADPDRIAAFVNDQVPYYERIEALELVDELPRTATGKVSRARLRTLLRERA